MKTRTLIKLLLAALWLFMFNECLAQWRAMEPIPTPRTNATASTLDGKIYVIGGVTERDAPALNTVEMYDPTTDTWDTDIADFPHPVTSASSQVVNGVLYVFGGKDRDGLTGPNYRATYAYDPVENKWDPKADMPTDAYQHKSVVVKDTIYVVGGVNGVTATRNVYAYDPAGDTWTQKTNLPMPRGLHTAQAIGNYIYAIGGVYDQVARNTVYRFQVESQEWESVASFPEPILFNGSGKMHDDIYVFGGVTHYTNGLITTKTRKLQIEVDTMYWIDVGADMPAEIFGYAYADAKDENGSPAIYFFSGATRAFYFPDGSPVLSGSTFKFSLDWKFMAPIPTPRAFAAASTLDGKIYVIGGVTERLGAALPKVEVYDPKTNTWDTTVTDYPLPVTAASSQVVGGALHVFGGKDRDGFETDLYTAMYAFNPGTNSWDQKASLPTPTFDHRSVVVADTLYCVGGVVWNGPSFIATPNVFAYDPKSDSWTQKDGLPMPRALLTVQAINDDIYAMGGAYLEVPTNTVYRYPYKTKKWETVTSLPEPNSLHGSGKLHGETYVFGGSTNWTTGSTTQKTRKLQIEPDTMYWIDAGADMPQEVIAYAYADAEDENGSPAIYLFSGATRAFYFPDGSPVVSGHTLKFSLDLDVVSETRELTYQQGNIRLLQNYPNPATGRTIFPIELENADAVTLAIVNMDGRVLAYLPIGNLATGSHLIEYDVSQLPAGIYFYQLRTGNGLATGKMIVQHPR